MQRKALRRAAVSSIAVGAAAIALHQSGALEQVLHAILPLGRLRPEAIGLALALSVLSLLINGAVWSRLLLQLGYKVRPSVGLAAFLSAGLGGYLVNAAGPAVGCALSLRRHGVCPGRAVLLSLLGSAVGFCAVLVWAVLVLARAGMDEALPLLGRHGPLAAAAVLVGLALVILVVLRALAGAPGTRNRLARTLLGEDPRAAGGGDGAGSAGASLRQRHLLALVPLSAAAWFSGVLALYMDVRGHRRSHGQCSHIMICSELRNDIRVSAGKQVVQWAGIKLVQR